MRASDGMRSAVDWVVGLVSPKRAITRAHFRRIESDPQYRETVFALLRARGYRAAHEGKNATSWRSNSLSADGETILDSPKLAQRSRELHRDDPLASGLLDTFARDMVGTELRARSAAPEQYRVLIDQVWEEQKSRLTPTDPGPLGQWLRTLANKFCEDGEAIVHRAIAEVGEPVWFETIERERLATPMDAEPQDKNGSIRAGVERDAHDRVVAYWIMKKHPGDAFLPFTKVSGSIFVPLGYSKKDFNRVPLDAIAIAKLTDRPGQSRGVGKLHAVLQDLRDFDLLILASLKRTQVAACFSLFITSAQSVPDLLEVTAENFGYRLDEEIVPGTIFKLFPGESVTTVNPNFPTPDLEPFLIFLARRIGAALGVSWQTVLRDWSTSSYSSARTQILADAPTTNVMRHDLRAGILDWIWRTVMEDAALRGDARLKGVPPEVLNLVQWIADGRPWIDPYREGQAVELKLKLGITTLRDECAAQGKDWEEQLEQKILEEKRELELRKKHGVAKTAFVAPPPTAPPADDGAEAEDATLDAHALERARRLLFGRAAA